MVADYGDYRNDAGGGSFAKSALVAGLAAVIGAGAALMLLAPERVQKLLGNEPAAVAGSPPAGSSAGGAGGHIVGTPREAPGAAFAAQALRRQLTGQ